MRNIQGLNEDANMLSTELNHNDEEGKECEDRYSESCMQPTTRNTDVNGNDNRRKSWLDLRSQFDAVCEACKATMKLTLENMILVTYDLQNNTAGIETTC